VAVPLKTSGNIASAQAKKRSFEIDVAKAFVLNAPSNRLKANTATSERK